MVHFIQGLLDQYGYYVLGIALMLELLALPLPGEVLMTYSGLMIYQGHLNWVVSILTAGCGASLGMTLSYWIGFKLGKPFFEKHGAKIHFGPDKLQKTSGWFERYGNKLLIIAYFIPGIRHFTGYFSGVTRMPLRTYMLYAYPGAFIWTGTFISLGKILGPKWEQFHHTITKYLLIAGVIAALMFIIVYVFKRYREQIYSSTAKGLSAGVATFHSLGRVRFLLLASFCVFLTLFILMAGLIEDFVGNEFADFDEVTTFIVLVLFEESWWSTWMNRFADLASLSVLLTIAALTIVWILLKSKDRLLEIGFMLFVLIGGEVWDEGLRRLFHRTGPQNVVGTFPSEQTLITIIFLGFAMFLFVRHLHVTWVRTGAVIFVLAVSLLVGLSRIYFNIQYPSDVVAGYVFGGVWLSLNVILLEIFRLIQRDKMNFSTSS
ncbi:VTT domain-containing protein [Paenibacillus aestuarii]|uniref:VTT domain-containing protein n=1 Tax=Paenibacillus aestuarii TaxID=516965 RepID=A0ABW0K7B9_9BACL|nr:VTT domain-containing protein [Paenibacillus aestuarii]